jgi:hypothetical protein
MQRYQAFGNIHPCALRVFSDVALFVLVKNMTGDKVPREIQDAGGVVLKTSLDDAKEKALREALESAAVKPLTGRRAARDSPIAPSCGKPD